MRVLCSRYGPAFRCRRGRGIRRRAAFAGRQASGAAGRRGVRRPGRGRAMTTAVGASNRPPCAAHPGVARRNSLRALRALRSDNRRENDGRSALRALTPRLRCSAPPTSPCRARAAARRAAPRRPTPADPQTRPAAECRSGNVIGARVEDGAVANEHHHDVGKGAGRRSRARRVRSREAQERRPAREARIVRLTRGDCLSGARAASVASFAAQAGVPSIAGHPREAGASTRRTRGRRPAPLPARPLPAQPFPAPPSARWSV